MGVKEEFHQRAILMCVDELCQRSTSSSAGAKELNEPTSSDGSPATGPSLSSSSSSTCSSSMSSSSATSVTSASSATTTATTTASSPPYGQQPLPPHRLVESSFPSLERCDKCHKYLRGLLHQGLRCHGQFPLGPGFDSLAPFRFLGGTESPMKSTTWTLKVKASPALWNEKDECIDHGQRDPFIKGNKTTRWLGFIHRGRSVE